jgi:hypothetical protein
MTVINVSIKVPADYLNNHKWSKHDGIKYDCYHCEHRATTQTNLTRHRKSKHEGIIYDCNQCDYKATTNHQLTSHRKSKHE